MNVLVVSDTDLATINSANRLSGNHVIAPVDLDDGSRILNADILLETGPGKLFRIASATLVGAPRTDKANPVPKATTDEAALSKADPVKPLDSPASDAKLG